MKKPFKKPGRLVEVHWLDSCSEGTWCGKRRPDNEPSLCSTVGYLMTRDRKAVTVAQNATSEGSSGAWMTIPASCVVSVRRLK